MTEQTNAALQGVVTGLIQSAPSIAIAAGALSPATMAIITVAQAFEPFIAQLFAARQAGLLTDAQVTEIVAQVKTKVTNAHVAWVTSVSANPGV